MDYIYPRKNWYPKPTPPNLQFEERHTFVNSSYYMKWPCSPMSIKIMEN